MEKLTSMLNFCKNTITIHAYQPQMEVKAGSIVIYLQNGCTQPPTGKVQEIFKRNGYGESIVRIYFNSPMRAILKDCGNGYFAKFVGGNPHIVDLPISAFINYPELFRVVGKPEICHEARPNSTNDNISGTDSDCPAQYEDEIDTKLSEDVQNNNNGLCKSFVRTVSAAGAQLFAMMTSAAKSHDDQGINQVQQSEHRETHEENEDGIPKQKKIKNSVDDFVDLDGRPEFIVPPMTLAEFEQGDDPKGIQGHRNSCYLDSTISAMFAFTRRFDSTILEDCDSDSSAEAGIRDILTRIVNELRQGYFCSSESILHLRKKLSPLNSKLLGSFMDPEEFILLLFDGALHLNEFIKYDNGASDFLHQIQFIPQPNLKIKPFVTTQRLLEFSMKNLKLKFQSIPSPALILEMPRSNGTLVNGLRGIIPRLTIDVTNYIVDAPRNCCWCDRPASVECAQCFGLIRSNHYSSLADSTSFCSSCYQSRHIHPESRQHQNPVSIQKTTGSRIKLQLLAVICIRNSHFVSFVRTNRTKDYAPWVFFDSSPNGKCPRYEILSDMGKWLEKLESVQMHQLIGSWSKQPAMLRRIVEDGHICIYYDATEEESN